MADSSSNYFPEAGQKQGEHHPQNPFAEQLYPSFYRLYDRGQVLLDPKKPSVEVDTDYYVANNFSKFVDTYLKKDDAAEVFKHEVAVPDYEAKGVEGEHHTQPYVPSLEIDVREVLEQRTFMVAAFYPIVQKYISSSQSAPGWFKPEAWQKVTDRLCLDTVLAGKADNLPLPTDEQAKKMYDRVVSQLGTLPPSAPLVLSVEKDLYNVIAGDDAFRFGGMFDGDVVPAKYRQLWLQNGLNVNILGDNVRQKMNALKNLRSAHIYGKELGAALDRLAFQSLELEVNFKRKKIGAWVIGIGYGAFAAWSVFYRFLNVNNREYLRQKAKYSYRVLDEEGPQTSVLKGLEDKHQEWASKYYEEDE